ncbi:hypothetical protein ACQPYH_00985 [Kribbella sp. CA-245084]|uniref:hypothetical protein n=1 Tax=Kribbella sp. CA-245084 TaxID=3239940 RepID=UPI003D9111DD
MTTLSLAAPALVDTFAQLRNCGAGRRECVVYWCAIWRNPDVVADVVHPDHRATFASYEVNSGWVTEFFLGLRRDYRRVLAQVHTHPGPANHSEIDDQFAIAPELGFLSLVIPNFATGLVTLRGAHLVEMGPTGLWREVRVDSVLR